MQNNYNNIVAIDFLPLMPANLVMQTKPKFIFGKFEIN